MATITCAYSGVVFRCDHFPMTLSERETNHPVFLLPQHKLLSYTSKWSSGELTATDSYLLFLALMDSTSLVEWRTSVKYIPGITDSLVASNMESLIRIIGKVNLIHHPRFVLPSFAVTRDTCNLDNVHYWIEAWHDSFLEFMRGYREQTAQERIIRREYALERMIRSTQLKNAKKYAIVLADWAEMVGQFPSFVMAHPITHNPVTLNNYWKEIIIACIREEKIFQYPTADVQELITHCEDMIPHGSISAASLMDLLRVGLKSQSSYLCLSDFDVTAYRNGTLSKEDVVETTNKLAMIQKAPLEKPVLSAYNSPLEFARANARWRMKQQYGDVGTVSEPPVPSASSTSSTSSTSSLPIIHKSEDI